MRKYRTKGRLLTAELRATLAGVFGGVAVAALLTAGVGVAQVKSGGGGCFLGATCQAKTLSINGAALGSDALAVNGTTAILGNFRVSSASLMGWNTRSWMASPVDGQVTLLNNGQIGFTRLNFGPATSAFPSLKVNGQSLDLRLGDDSAYASLTGNILTGGVLNATISIKEQKITQSNLAPGSGLIKLETVAGTNAGTCKLIAYAGTSATPVTVVDNVGTGC